MSVFTCDEFAYICITLYEQMCLSMQVVSKNFLCDIFHKMLIPLLYVYSYSLAVLFVGKNTFFHWKFGICVENMVALCVWVSLWVFYVIS